MTDRVERAPSRVILIAMTIGIFALEPACLRAEALAQAGTGNTIEMVEPKRLSAQEIGDRGIRFRAELDKAFNALGDGDKAGHANGLTAIAASYISAGMALEDAVGILNAAGFAAPPPPRARDARHQSRADWYAVVAEIPQFAARRHRMMYYPRP